MRSIQRTLRVLDRGILRDIGLVCLADTVVGVSYGAISVGSGFPVWAPMLLSVVVFAGAAQFMFVGIVASGGSPVAAVAAALLVNARHLPFGFAVAEVLRGGWGRRLLGTHLMIDETVAFALAQEDARRRRAVYWLTGACLFACWNAGVLAGAFAGSAVKDTSAFGLDAAFPAVLLALVLPSLRKRETGGPMLVGAAIALVTTPLLPAGLPVLCGLAGVLVSLARERRRAEAVR